MKSKIQLLVIAIVAILAMVHLESCSQYRSFASKPDGHNRYHPDFALNNLIKKHHNNDYYKHGGDAKASANNTAKPAAPVAAAPASMDTKTVGNIGSMTASTSNEVPTMANGKDMYKLLTEEERMEAKAEVDKIFAKRPILRTFVDAKLNKLNEKYPAAAQSSFKKADGGGGLGTGEILAIVALACSLTWILGIAGLIIGIIALGKIKRDGGAMWAKILAIVAIVLGAIDLLTFIIWLALLIIATRGI